MAEERQTCRENKEEDRKYTSDWKRRTWITANRSEEAAAYITELGSGSRQVSVSSPVLFTLHTERRSETCR